MPVNLNPFEDEYRFLFDSCIIREDKYPEIDQTIQKILNHKDRYEHVSNQLNIPWNFIAIVHCMEGSLSFTKHLHNGDPLTARTVHVPAGRPKSGNPPFTWEQSAIDALTLEGFTGSTNWSVPGMLYAFEKFNGMGYRKHGIRSPYLWSYSLFYTKGKFTNDGVFNPNAVSRQVGAAVLLRRMSEKQIAVQGDTDRLTMIKNLGAEVVFDPNNFHNNALQLQKLLNSVGLHLRLDGKAGKMTSDAYHSVTGDYLKGDNRSNA